MAPAWGLGVMGDGHRGRKLREFARSSRALGAIEQTLQRLSSEWQKIWLTPDSGSRGAGTMTAVFRLRRNFTARRVRL
jgi:hypothetical protein